MNCISEIEKVNKGLFTRNLFSPFLSAAPLIFFAFCNVMCEQHQRINSTHFKTVRKPVQKTLRVNQA